MYQSNFRDNRREFKPRRDFGPRRNEFIRVPQVRVIGAEGENLGVLDTQEALRLAKEAGLDLVEVGADAKPPVCKIIDFAKYQYELNKKQRKSKNKTKSMKEFRFSPVIAEHDLETRVRRSKEYLDQGHQVRLTMRRKGRQTHEQAIATFKDILTKFADYSTIEPAPKTEGRQITITLKSDGKAKNKKNSSEKNQENQPKGEQEAKIDVHQDSSAPLEDKKVIKGEKKEE